MIKHFLLIGITVISFALFTSMTISDVVDYLSTGKLLTFNKDKYDLAWSSHPSDNYYKQEFIKQGEKLDRYHNMILVEAIEGDLKIKDALETKVAELETRKKWDVVANYKVYENKNKPDEGIIDFVVSDTMTTYEWNLYRYQLQKGIKNNTMVLFAYSFRDSLNDNNDLKIFFDRIKEKRTDLINKLQAYSIPEIKIYK